MNKKIIMLLVAITSMNSNNSFGMQIQTQDDIPRVDLFRTKLSVIANLIHKTYYLKPYTIRYPRDIIIEGVPRTFHGGMHIIRVALLVQYLIKFYKKYNYNLQDAEAAELLNSPENIHLLIIAALLHDSGRKGEEEDLWEEDSYNNCFNFLQVNDIDEQTAAKFASSIKKVRNRAERTFLQHIITTADAIDIIRTRGWNGKYCAECEKCLAGMAQECEIEKQYGCFDMSRLAPFSHFADNESAKEELRDFIFKHRNLLREQGDIWFPAPITIEETNLLLTTIERYRINRTSRQEFIENKNFFRHALSNRDDVEDADKETLYKMDRSWNPDQKRVYESTEDCYHKIEHEFNQAQLTGHKRTRRKD